MVKQPELPEDRVRSCHSSGPPGPTLMFDFQPVRCGCECTGFSLLREVSSLRVQWAIFEFNLAQRLRYSSDIPSGNSLLFGLCDFKKELILVWLCFIFLTSPDYCDIISHADHIWPVQSNMRHWALLDQASRAAWRCSLSCLQVYTLLIDGCRPRQHADGSNVCVCVCLGAYLNVYKLFYESSQPQLLSLDPHFLLKEVRGRNNAF